MKIKINNDERVIFLGTTGSGKTVLAKHFLEQMNRVLVIDPKHTFQLDGYTRAKKLPMFGKDFHIIYRPKLEDDDDLAELVYKLNKARNVTIYCDELSTVSEMFSNTTRMLADVARTGRERHVALWNSVQRPRWTPRIFFTEAEVIFQFNLRSAEDRAYISGFTSPDVLDPLDKFNFWYSRADEQGVILMMLDMARHGIIQVEQNLFNNIKELTMK